MTRAFASLATAVLAVGLSGCSVPTAEVTAQCHFESASPEDRFKAGVDLRHISDNACLGLGVLSSLRASVGAELPYKREVEASFEKLAADDASFRAGQYARLLSGNPRAGKEAQAALGELGLRMEQVASVRAQSLSCGLISAEDLEVVGQLDALFVLATTGTRVGVPDLGLARELTDKLMERALDQAQRRQGLTSACDADLETTLKEHLAEWQAFYAGEHPWTPGCRAEVTNEEFVLRCS